MKFKPFLLASLAGAGLFKVYQEKDRLLSNFNEKRQLIKKSQEDVISAKENLDLIQEQVNHATQVGQELTYKYRVFNTEAQVSLTEIKKILAKYQKNETTSQND